MPLAVLPVNNPHADTRTFTRTTIGDRQPYGLIRTYPKYFAANRLTSLTNLSIRARRRRLYPP